MSADVQLWIHGVGDIVVQCGNADRRDVLREPMRRLCCPNERRSGGLHQLTRERSNVSAHVQLGVHCIGDVFMQCGNADRRDVLRESMRRVGGSHERWRGRLHQITHL